MLRGANPLTIDPKGRMVMPTRYRELLQESCEGKLVVTVDKPQCLLIYPLTDWLDIERRLMRLPNTDDDTRLMQRMLVGSATEVDLDSQGRLLIPQKLRDFALLTRDAVLVGQGVKFELWDEARWSVVEKGWVGNGPTPGSAMSEPLKSFYY